MVNGDEILNSILEDMKKYEKEFNELENKKATLQQNYVEEMKKLQTRQEQVRGLYTGLFDQYRKFSSEKVPEDTTATTVKTDTEQVAEPEKEVVPEVVETVNEEKASSLTPNEIETIKNSIQASESDDDVPDYLK